MPLYFWGDDVWRHGDWLKVVNREAMANPGCLEWYVEFARRVAQ
jgi:hypothetical protein